MNFDEIIMLVKEAISKHGTIDVENDEVTLDCNDIDHIANYIATALCGKETEQ